MDIRDAAPSIRRSTRHSDPPMASPSVWRKRMPEYPKIVSDSLIHWANWCCSTRSGTDRYDRGVRCHLYCGDTGHLKHELTNSSAAVALAAPMIQGERH